MKRTVRSIIGAVAGAFFTFAIFQALWAIPDFRASLTPVIEAFARGIAIGAVIFAIIGAIFLYISVKGR